MFEPHLDKKWCYFLKKKRYERNLSQQQMADLLKITQAEVSRLEGNERRLRIDTIKRYSDALNIDYEVFLNEYNSYVKGQLETDIYVTETNQKDTKNNEILIQLKSGGKKIKSNLSLDLIKEIIIDFDKNEASVISPENKATIFEL